MKEFFGEGAGGHAGVLRGVVVGVVLGVVGNCEGKFHEWCVSLQGCIVRLVLKLTVSDVDRHTSPPAYSK